MSDANSFSDFPQTEIRTLFKIGPDDRLHAAAHDSDHLQERKSHPDGKRDNAKRTAPGRFKALLPESQVPLLHRFSNSKSRIFILRTGALTHCAACRARARHAGASRGYRCYRRLMQNHHELRASAMVAPSALAAQEARRALTEIDALSRGDRLPSKHRKSGFGDGQ